MRADGSSRDRRRLATRALAGLFLAVCAVAATIMQPAYWYIWFGAAFAGLCVLGRCGSAGPDREERAALDRSAVTVASSCSLGGDVPPCDTPLTMLARPEVAGDVEDGGDCCGDRLR